jgi:hypothetical protein
MIFIFGIISKMICLITKYIKIFVAYLKPKFICNFLLYLFERENLIKIHLKLMISRNSFFINCVFILVNEYKSRDVIHSTTEEINIFIDFSKQSMKLNHILELIYKLTDLSSYINQSLIKVINRNC